MSIVKTFHCPNCNGCLKNLHVSSGICEYCGSAYTIESITAFDNSISEEKITAGISFTADASAVNQHIVDFLTKSIAAPLDVLSDSRVTEVQAFALPAFHFHSNSELDFMCDIGNDMEHTFTDKDGNTSKVTDTVWSTLSGKSCTNVEGIVSGNEAYDKIVNNFYIPYESGQLVSCECLEIPYYANVIRFTRPENSISKQFIEPLVKSELTKQIEGQLKGRYYKNLSCGTPTITMDVPIKRIVVGLYSVSLEYHDTQYTLFISADGRHFYTESDNPLDPKRDEKIHQLSSNVNLKEVLIALLFFGLFIAVVLGIYFVKTIYVPILAVLAIGLGIYPLTKMIPKRKELKEALTKEKGEVETIRKAFSDENLMIAGLNDYV